LAHETWRDYQVLFVVLALTPQERDLTFTDRKALPDVAAEEARPFTKRIFTTGELREYFATTRVSEPLPTSLRRKSIRRCATPVRSMTMSSAEQLTPFLFERARVLRLGDATSGESL
jgi:hypothetical protein